MLKSKINSGYVPELDGIRGIAILAVMLFHTGIPIFKGGFIGVDIFFVLSGFLITSLLIKEYDKTLRINLKYFYIRRILRLFPALFILLITLLVLSLTLFKGNQSYTSLKSILISLFYSANWVRAFNLYEMGVLNHTWSLSIEEQFYILWPVLLLVFFRIIKSRDYIALAVVILALSSWVLRIIMTFEGIPADRIYNGLDTRADALLIGCLSGIVLNSGTLISFIKEKIFYLEKYTLPAAAIFFLAILTGISWRNPHVFYWLGFLAEIFSAFLIMHIFLLKSSLLKKILSLRPIVWTGSLSYGLYLWHDPVFETLRIRGYSIWAITIFGTLATFAIASLSFYLIEKPILRLKENFSASSRLQKNTEPAVIKSDAAAMPKLTRLYRKN